MVPALVAASMIITGIGGCRVADRSARATDPSGASSSGASSTAATTPGPSAPEPVTSGLTDPPASASGSGAPSTAVPSTGLLADLTPDTDGLRLGRPVNGIRHGELIVTIRNNGPVAVPEVYFSVEVPESMRRGAGDWAGCTDLISHRPGFPAGAICRKGPLAPGQTVTFRLGMTSPASQDGADSRISRWLIDAWAGGPDGERTPDARPQDNRRIFSVYRD